MRAIDHCLLYTTEMTIKYECEFESCFLPSAIFILVVNFCILNEVAGSKARRLEVYDIGFIIVHDTFNFMLTS